MLQDLRSAIRTLRSDSSFTFVAVVVLALGIAFSIAIFSVVNAVFFRPRAIASPKQVVHIFQLLKDNPKPFILGVPWYRYLREHNESFTDLTGHWGTANVLRADGEAASVAGEHVLANYFDVLGVKPLLGRTFMPAEDDPANPALAMVISHDLWTRRFNGDPQVLGKEVSVGGWSEPERLYTVVGVMGPEFLGVNNPWRPSRFWITFAQRTPERHDRLAFAVIARLKPDLTLAQAQAVVATQGTQIGIERGLSASDAADRRLVVYPSRDVRMPFDPTAIVVPQRLAIAAMLVSLTVLIVAVSNVTGIVMAQSVTRSGEVAIRRALGASGGRILRQFLSETLLVAFLGASVGLLLAHWLLQLFHAATPGKYAIDVSIDMRVLLFASTVCVVAGVLIGVLPAAQSARINLAAMLVGSAGVVRSPIGRLRYGFVIPQIALSLALLAVAAVQVRALARIETQDRGYQLDRLLVVYPALRALPGTPVSGPPPTNPRAVVEKHAERTRRFYTRLLQRLRSSPDLAAVGIGEGLAVHQGHASHSAVTVEALDAGTQNGPSVVESIISPGYHAAMGTRLIAGRDFDETDTRTSPKVAIVDSVLAERLWPGGDALGRPIAIINLFPAAGEQPERLTVVGVVEPTRPIMADGPPTLSVYLAMGQQWHPSVEVIVARGSGNPAELTNIIKNDVVAADILADVHRARTGPEIAAEILYPRRMAIVTLTLAGMSGLLLASIGLYGVISYSVAQRVYELGVRAALGADRRDIIGLILREGLVVLTIASAIGLALSIPATRASSKLAAGLPSSDPVAVAVTLMFLISVVLVASYIPARRAAALDPLDALRRL